MGKDMPAQAATYLVQEILATASNRQIPIGTLPAVVSDFLHALKPSFSLWDAGSRAILKSFVEIGAVDFQDFSRYSTVDGRAHSDGNGGDGEEAWVGLARKHGYHAGDFFERKKASY